MPSLRYRDYYISVLHIPDKSGDSSCIACVEIRHKLHDSPAAKGMLSGALLVAHDVDKHGFTMGKQWVDDRIAKKSVSSDRIETEAGDKLLPVRAGFKDWLALLIARIARLVSGALPERRDGINIRGENFKNRLRWWCYQQPKQ